MIQIIPKPEKKVLTLEIIFLFISIFILIASLLTFLYLTMAEKNINQEITTWDEKISNLESPEILALENKILQYQQKISDFSTIIGEHLFPSQFFSFLEKNTHPNVYFSEIKLDLLKSECFLLGKTQSFYTLSQQLQILKSNESFQTNLSRVSISKEGNIEFGLEIIFDKNILKK